MTTSSDKGIRHGWYRRDKPPNENLNRHHSWPLAGTLLEPPPSVLRRHGARISPATDDGTAGSTVYRTETLLVPTSLLQEQAGLLDSDTGALDGILNGYLAPTGWYIDSAPPAVSPAHPQLVTKLRLRQLSDLPGHGGAGAAAAGSPPDAYQALRLLRQATAGGSHEAVAAHLSLDHLFFAISAIDGMPITEGHGDRSRVPVAVLASPPRRRPTADVPGGRRPVVAVLDTGIGEHTWLGTSDPANPDFWVDAKELGWTPQWDDSVGPPKEGSGISRPLVGTLDSHAGHGTFIAGLIRQMAPDASVLSLHVMYGDGVIHESDAINALGWLYQRASSGNTADFVDVICLSFGYHEETPADAAVTSAFAQALAALGNLGIRVVAAAGNNASETETYPAALAVAQNQPAVSVVSVGALNPTRTRALYSNEAYWITDWEVGTALISTMPQFDGGMMPDIRISDQQNGTIRESQDPDNFKGGFAIWSGTSFAAAAYAGRLAQALITPYEALPSDQSLTDVTPAQARSRAEAALDACRPK